GDIAPVEKIVDLAKKNGALTYLDEVHAIGLYGPQGAGIASLKNAHIDIIQGTLGKAFAQCGGYIVANKTIIDAVRSFGDGFIFTTALPPAILAGALAGLEIIKKSTSLRDKIAVNTNKLKALFERHHLPILPSSCHIIPLMVGNAFACKEISSRLLKEYYIYIQPINYPTVARGLERLRITINPAHDEQMMHDLVDAIKHLWHQLGLDEAF
ncbi:MAG: aminotransferase class I/II-fold pyridoxal phosphate-dependent enzyme, partial [Pseudomonadota bacterium]